MKGILLAGGSGTRLYPLTEITSKQLLPIYNKPMIYYPLSILMKFDIKDVLIISTPQDTPNIKKLLKDGKQLGINISYAIQEEPNGIAEAFLIGSDFIANDDVCLILGDNIFYMGEQIDKIKENIYQKSSTEALIFAYHVSDPERFGVVEFDNEFAIKSIEEKPEHPKSNYVSVGLYIYPKDVVKRAKTLTKSKRNELEISDLNNLYLKDNSLKAIPMGRGIFWIDAGTPKSLFEASSFMKIVEERQDLNIACIEEIAYRKGFITKEQMLDLIASMNQNSTYCKYLKRIIEEQHELY